MHRPTKYETCTNDVHSFCRLLDVHLHEEVWITDRTDDNSFIPSESDEYGEIYAMDTACVLRVTFPLGVPDRGPAMDSLR